MDAETTIIIADDHPLLRSGLRMIIESDENLKVVAEAENGEQAITLIVEHEPDVAVLDLDMPLKDGFEVVKAAQKKNLATGVIILTMHNNEALFNAAFDLGVKGFVLKDGAMTEIVDCIKAVAAGDTCISPQLSGHLVNRENRAALAAPAGEKSGLKDLTPAERSVFRSIAAGKTSRQIADELFISVRTVERHRANICRKLDLRGINALTKFALTHKFPL